MKRIVMLILILLFLYLPTVGFGEEVEQEENTTEPIEAVETQEEQNSIFIPTFRNIDVVNLNENQMALLMINNQIEYLMNQIEANDKQVKNLNESFQKRLLEEQENQNKLRQEHVETVKGLEEKIAAKDRELQIAKDELHEVEKNVAIYIGESGLYLKILVGFIIGIITGLLLGTVLGWKKRKNQTLMASENHSN